MATCSDGPWSSNNACRRINPETGGTMQVSSDWPIGIILIAAVSLTGSRGEYLRFIVIRSEG